MNYWHSCLYPLFLSSLKSCTLINFTDEELQAELDHFTLRSIGKFKFPKISLEYGKSEDGYYFINNLTQKEINVILAWMKVYWLEYQLSKEEIYQNTYADKDVKAFSSGNLIASIQKAYDSFVTSARKEEEDYGRVNKEGRPAIGDING